MKILIADSHSEVQSALRLIASRNPAITEVREEGSLVELLAQCAQSCPELILFDRDLVRATRRHPLSLADLIRVLRRLCPSSQIVVMGSRFEAKQEALEAGANGFISKTDPPDEVLSSIIQFSKTI